MKKLIIISVAFIVSLVVFHSCNEPITEEQVGDELSLKSAPVAKSYIVVLNDAELNTELSKLKGYEKKQEKVKTTSAKILKRASITGGELGFVYGTALKGFSVKIPPGQLKKLEADPSVKYIEEDGTIILAPPLSINAVSATNTQTIPWGITRVNGGGENISQDSPRAWIVDSGIDMDHPDLNVNTTLSKSFVLGDNSPEDAHGHGTHVAGTVAAINNDIGVIGVAPNAEVISCRVLGSDGSGAFSWTVAALDYIAELALPGDVVNMSLGPNSRFIHQATDDAVIAVANLGIKIAIAAGNSSDDASYYSPARVNNDNVYTIAAMAEGDVWASYSNFGSPVDYIEPGSYVTSTYIGGYATMSGTSMASPHMAGILLLGEFVSDGTVSIKKRRDVYEYPIAIVNGGTTPPSNQAPNADFTFSVADLTVSFTNKSSDSDGNITSHDWDFGDGGSASTIEPSHTYGTSGTYSVTLTVTDNDGATDSYTTSVTVSEDEPPVGGITLTATGYKVRGVRHANLGWDQITTGVDIYRNGTLLKANVKGSVYDDVIGKISGTFIYQVIETNGTLESNEVTVTI